MPIGLTNKHYEAIGRLALAFNEVEDTLDWFCELFVSTSEWRVSCVICREDATFDRKLQRFRRIVRAISEDRPEFKSFADSIDEMLTNAKSLSIKRNDYVHALVVVNLHTKQPTIRIKGTDVICDADAILELSRKMNTLGNELARELGEFYDELHDAREKNSKG